MNLHSIVKGWKWRKTDTNYILNFYIMLSKKTAFKIKKRKARVARNPRTGEVVPIPDRLVPVFKPSNELKALVMGE